VTGDDLARLLWLLRRFRRQVEVDLLQHVGADLGVLWRGRRWRLLLNLIDHLPRHTWTQQAMADDPEYAQKIADAVAARKAKMVVDDDELAWSPPLQQYTPEVEALASVVDAVNALRTTFIMANSEKGAQPPQIPPYPRPVTLVATMREKAQRKARWTAHETLADRMLPGRRKP
jgi:hypothetical protein